MRVLKFGGTSMGSAARMQIVKEIVCSQQEGVVVVLSAMSGVTTELLSVDKLLRAEQRNQEMLEKRIDQLKRKHHQAVLELLNDVEQQGQTLQLIDRLIDGLMALPAAHPNLYSEVVTLGERLSSQLFAAYLASQFIDHELLDAADFMWIENQENPDLNPVRERLDTIFRDRPSKLYITQGFLCRDGHGTLSNLQRGGSDYSASLIAAALRASEVQIWTDIDGFRNNDPRYVEGTKSIQQLSYDEAAELAYFGAKILHPKTVAPARKLKLPIYIKNTFDPQAAGTLISDHGTVQGLKAIAAKDGITAVKIKSNQMLMAYGFLRKVFEIFERYQTPIDMITTSEIAVSLTIDDPKNLVDIVKELEHYGEISTERDQSIISIVGESLMEQSNTLRLFQLLTFVPVRMISYGGSRNNISLLVQQDQKQEALQQLNTLLFQTAAC